MQISCILSIKNPYICPAVCKASAAPSMKYGVQEEEKQGPKSYSRILQNAIEINDVFNVVIPLLWPKIDDKYRRAVRGLDPVNEDRGHIEWGFTQFD